MPLLGSLDLSENDRILVLAPHPDDEVLGAGGVLQRALAMRLPVKVVFLTNGDSNQWSFLLYRKHPVVMPKAVEKMGMVRRDEALAAGKILGINRQDLVFLGYPDFGTMNIWYGHWDKQKPYRSVLTRVTKVPYQGSLREGAPYKGEEIVKDLRAVLKEFKPTKIFVSHPADHNGDHLSCYLFLKVALWDEQMEEKVALYPYLIHYIRWPQPIGFLPNLFFTPPESMSPMVKWVEFRLTDKEMEVKKTALVVHKTQYLASKKYLLSFIRKNELFGDFSPVKLHLNEVAPIFSLTRRLKAVIELPEELNENEKVSYVGVEWKFVRWEGDNLIVSIELSKPLAKDVQASMYFFGYNQNVPFEQMPKISVRLGVRTYNVYNQNRRIEKDAVMVNRSAHEVTISLPLKLLGHPQRILTSARTFLGNVPLGNASWVRVELVD